MWYELPPSPDSHSGGFSPTCLCLSQEDSPKLPCSSHSERRVQSQHYYVWRDYTSILCFVSQGNRGPKRRWNAGLPSTPLLLRLKKPDSQHILRWNASSLYSRSLCTPGFICVCVCFKCLSIMFFPLKKQKVWLSFNRHEFERTLGDSEGQGSLVCCSPWGCRVGHDLATTNILSLSTSVLQGITSSPVVPISESMGSLRVGQTERLHFLFSLWCIGEGNGNPLQCSCLENPRDGGAWWDAVCGVTQSRTRLQWLSSSSKRYQIGVTYCCGRFATIMWNVKGSETFISLGLPASNPTVVCFLSLTVSWAQLPTCPGFWRALCMLPPP